MIQQVPNEAHALLLHAFMTKSFVALFGVLACSLAFSACSDRERDQKIDPASPAPEPLGHTSQKIGSLGRASVCINGPSVYGAEIDEAGIETVIALGAECVRLNLRQDVWNSIDDPTPHGSRGLSLLATYDIIVNRYREAGLNVYVLVGAEAAGIPLDAARWQWGLDAYASAFTSIVSHFRDRAYWYEAFNEPNNWVAKDYPALDPASFARMLARVWNDVHGWHPDWDVRLIAGAPLAFHQVGGDSTTAADYLDQTFAAGIANEGWQEILDAYGSWPADAYGYHFYLDFESSHASAQRVTQFIDAYWSTITKYEGSGTGKRIFISEFGWQSDDTPWGDAEQARELDAAYGALLGDYRIAMGMWFNLLDHYEGENLVRWGLYRIGGYDEAHARPARDHFRAVVGHLYDGTLPPPPPPPPTPGPGPNPPPSTPTNALDVRAWIDDGSWLTQCSSDGSAENAFQTSANGRQDGGTWGFLMYPQTIMQSCGDAPDGQHFPVVFRSHAAGDLGGTWVTQCSGAPHVAHVYRVDAVVDDHPAGVFLYDEESASCP